MKKDQRQEVRLSDAERSELRKAADELGISVSELIRRGAMAFYRQRIAMRRANADRQRSKQNPQN